MKWSIPERIVSKGRKYMEEGRVLSIVADESQQIWHAEVLGSERYLVELDATAKEEDYCQCPYWQEHGYCKHTVAVELALKKAGKNRHEIINQAASFNRTPAQLLANQLKKLQVHPQGYLDSMPLSLSFQVEVLEVNPYHPEHQLLVVSLRTGYQGERSYLVKNIAQFLQCFQESNYYTLNSKKRYFVAPELFSKEERALIEYLIVIYQHQEGLAQLMTSTRLNLEKKYLALSLADLSQLASFSAQNLGCLVIEHQKRQPFTVAKPQQQLLTFSLTKKGDSTQLDITDGFEHLFTYYQMGLKENTFYPLTSQQMRIYQSIHQLKKRFDQPILNYADKEILSFFQQQLPLLEQIADIQVDETLKQQIVNVPLITHFYFMKQQGQLVLQVDYRYADTIFSTNPKRNQEQITPQLIMRDQASESRIERFIEMLGFVPNAKGYQRNLPTGSSLYHFFTVELAQFAQFGHIHLGEKLQALKISEEKLAVQLAIDRKQSWLDIRFEVSGIADHEVNQLVQALIDEKAYYTTETGQIVDLTSESFTQVAKSLQAIRQFGQLKGKHYQLPLYRGAGLKELLAQSQELSVGQAYEQFVHDLTHPEQFNASVPKQLNAQLRNYQLVGFRWLKMLSSYQLGGILADEMGLGKTLQTISYLLSEKEEHQHLQALIVAPASLVYNWQQECQRFAPSLKVSVASGQATERAAQIAKDSDIIITSYASLRQDIELYKQKTFDCLIVDEAQMVKNSQTKTARALRELAIAKRFALSGTPIENRLDELWSIFQMIMPGFFPSQQAFRKLSTTQVAQMIQPFVLRREKQNVLTDLPEKIDINYYSSLTDEQKTIYLAQLESIRQALSQMDSQQFRQSRMSILAGLTRLRQICCSPVLFMPDYQAQSGKLEQLKALVSQAKANQRRILIFSQFTSMLDIIQKELADLGFASFYLRGSTPSKERIEMVDAFNAGECDIFLISLKAGGTGLNLTGANTVILYDLWWNPAVEEQAASRAHRMGQKETVEVWRLIAQGTIEERMYQLQQEKRELFDQVMQGSEQSLHQLTEEDIRQIFAMGEEE